MEYKITQMVGDESCRYVLANGGHKPLVVIGVNPSTANESKSDQTMRKVMGFAERNGYDGFVMLNLYPQRSTDFSGVHGERNEELHQKNLEAIRSFFETHNQLDVLAAWGEKIGKRSYLKDCLRDIVSVLQEGERRVTWMQIGALTNTGHPRHPSRPGYNCGLGTFDVVCYLEKGR